jgi:hypothetical protein
MRGFFEQMPKNAAGALLLVTAFEGLLTEASDAITTEADDAILLERGAKRQGGRSLSLEGYTHATTDAPSDPTMIEGIAFASDGTMHITTGDPASALHFEGFAVSSDGVLHVTDAATGSPNVSGLLVTESGQVFYA